jgi:hypothetical protein
LLFGFQVTLEEQMICGALQTLNEDAFEDVAVSESRPSPTGELILHQYSLAPISEELGSPTHSRNCVNFFDNPSTTIITNNPCSGDSSPKQTVITIPNYSTTPSIDDTPL